MYFQKLKKEKFQMEKEVLMNRGHDSLTIEKCENKIQGLEEEAKFRSSKVYDLERDFDRLLISLNEVKRDNIRLKEANLQRDLIEEDSRTSYKHSAQYVPHVRTTNVAVAEDDSYQHHRILEHIPQRRASHNDQYVTDHARKPTTTTTRAPSNRARLMRCETQRLNKEHISDKDMYAEYNPHQAAANRRRCSDEVRPYGGGGGDGGGGGYDEDRVYPRHEPHHVITYAREQPPPRNPRQPPPPRNPRQPPTGKQTPSQTGKAVSPIFVQHPYADNEYLTRNPISQSTPNRKGYCLLPLLVHLVH